MKVITENDITIEKVGADKDAYWNASGNLVKKAKGLVGSGKVQGVLAALGNSNQSGPAPINMTPPPAPVKPGMSKGMKIGLGIAGGLLLVGAIWYFVKRKKK